MQYGEADIQGRDFSNQDLRRSNFTSADCRNATFKGSNLQGAYFIKAVTYRTNFEVGRENLTCRLPTLPPKGFFRSIPPRSEASQPRSTES